ncbi:WD repeat-containing protein 86-like [Oppia nitens]|uniref:WD repeat-containing protein 86-like n=1 Tax=Oppia nitens TaxID=1686743 RepID=UPI0023DAF279|nr:WD repeat-containing protein 86-like [Oppia nitens]
MGCMPSKSCPIIQVMNNTEDKPQYLLQTILDHNSGVNCIDISEDRSLLISGGEDCMARLWSTQSHPCECIGVLDGHQSYITCCAVYKHLVVTGSADNTIKVWTIEEAQCIATFIGHQSVVNHVICEGQLILSTSYDKTARIWSLYNNFYKNSSNVITNPIGDNHQCDQQYCVKILEGHDKAVTQVAIICNDEYRLQNGLIHELDLVVTASTDTTVRIWTLITGECHKVLVGHKGPVNCVVSDSNNKRHVYTGGADAVIKCWDVITGDLIRDLKGHESAILCLTSHNRILYSGSADQTARAWAMEYGECTRVYWRNTNAVTCVQYYDGIVYTASGDCTARLYDANSGALKRTCLGHNLGVGSLKVSPGKMFTGSYDGKVCVWDCTGIVADTVFGNNVANDDDNSDQTYEDSANVQNAVKALDCYIRSFR